MSTSTKMQGDPHSDVREGVRSLCNEFDSAYWQKVDEERGYPEFLAWTKDLRY